MTIHELQRLSGRVILSPSFLNSLIHGPITKEELLHSYDLSPQEVASVSRGIFAALAGKTHEERVSAFASELIKDFPGLE